ncbi:MAG: hypothetical protein AAGI09_05965 [Pseudomonadota bacterium]
MSDPKTPNETPEDQVSDTDQAPDSLDAEATPKPDEVIEDAEILDEQPDEAAADDDTAETAEEAPETDAPEAETAAEDTAGATEETVSDEDFTDDVSGDETPAEEAAQDGDTDLDTENPADTPEAIEPEPQPEPEPEPISAAPAEPAPQPAPVVVQKKGGFMGPFLGGVVAAGLGFGLCYYLVGEGIIGTEDNSAEIAKIGGLESSIAALQSEMATVAAAPSEDPRVDAIAGAVESVEGTVSDVANQIGTLQGELGTLQSEISAQTGLISNLEEQMAAIAALPEGTETADSAAMVALQATLAQQQEANAAMQAQLAEAAAAAQAQMEAAQAEMEAVRTQAGALQSETQSAVDEASNRAFVSNLAAALENGSSFAGAVDGITVAVPDALTTVADSGVETLLDLQRQFPAAARAGLADSLKATVGDAPQDRVFAFLRAQVGARSLEAREGDDPDAVLSRAQEAVNSGQLEAALAEIAALPAEGQAAMGAWIGAAQARVDAIAALDAFATEINSN